MMRRKYAAKEEALNTSEEAIWRAREDSPTEKITVKSIDDFFDEKAEALTMNINDHKFCLNHKWVNASLDWRKGNRYVSIESPGYPGKDGEIYGKFGGGYGGIRYCRRCKTINCIHWWKSETTYYVEVCGKYMKHGYLVGLCNCCGKRILRNSWSNSCPDPGAWPIINEALTSLGIKNLNGYGSMWFTDFPVSVSLILERQGREPALIYSKNCFALGTCERVSTWSNDVTRRGSL